MSGSDYLFRPGLEREIMVRIVVDHSGKELVIVSSLYNK